VHANLLLPVPGAFRRLDANVEKPGFVVNAANAVYRRFTSSRCDRGAAGSRNQTAFGAYASGGAGAMPGPPVADARRPRARPAPSLAVTAPERGGLPLVAAVPTPPPDRDAPRSRRDREPVEVPVPVRVPVSQQLGAQCTERSLTRYVSAGAAGATAAFAPMAWPGLPPVPAAAAAPPRCEI
jgi:hypothetical protein